MVPPVASRARSTASQSRGEPTGWGASASCPVPTIFACSAAWRSWLACFITAWARDSMLGRVEELVGAPRVVELYRRYGVARLEV